MVLEKLMRLGLSEYEAKVYSALVALGKASARDIHEVSGVPRARVYDVLRKLARKGFVDIEEGEPKEFSAVSPKIAIGRLRDEIIKIAEECITELESMKPERKYLYSPALVTRGERNIIERIKESIAEAKSEILIVSAKIDFILSIVDDLCKWSEKNRKVVCYLIESDERILKYADCMELWEAVEITPVMRKIHLDGFAENGVRTTIVSLLSFDGKKSIIVFDEGGQLSALVITLPTIAIMHNTMVKLHFSRIARRIA